VTHVAAVTSSDIPIRDNVKARKIRIFYHLSIYNIYYLVLNPVHQVTHIVRVPLVRTAVHLEHKMQCVNGFINPLYGKIDLHGLIYNDSVRSSQTTHCFHQKYEFG